MQPAGLHCQATVASLAAAILQHSTANKQCRSDRQPEPNARTLLLPGSGSFTTTQHNKSPPPSTTNFECDGCTTQSNTCSLCKHANTRSPVLPYPTLLNATTESSHHFSNHSLVVCVLAIFFCSCMMPYSRPSAVGGQPGT